MDPDDSKPPPFNERELLAGLSRLHGLVQDSLRSCFDDDDIRQEVLKRALENPPENIHYGGWLRAAARSVRIDMQRRNTRRRTHELAATSLRETQTAVPDSEAAAMASEAAEVLQEAIASLPQIEATCIRLRFFEGLRTSQIAKRLSVTPDTVLRREKQGLAKLRKRVKASLGCLAAFALLDVNRSLAATVLARAPSSSLVAISQAGFTARFITLPRSLAAVTLIGLGLLSIPFITPDPETLATSSAATDVRGTSDPVSGAQGEFARSATPPTERAEILEEQPPSLAPSRRIQFDLVDDHASPIREGELRVSGTGLLTGAWIAADDHGSATAQVPTNWNTYFVQARAAGRGTVFQSFHRDQGTSRIVLWMSESRPLSGRVLSAAGTPVPGALIASRSAYGPTTSISEATTDDEGRFTVDVIGRSHLSVVSATHELINLVVASHVRSLEPLYLTPAPSASFEVSDTQQHLENVIHLTTQHQWLPPSASWCRGRDLALRTWPIRSYDLHSIDSAGLGWTGRSISTSSTIRHLPIAWSEVPAPPTPPQPTPVEEPCETVVQGQVLLNGQPLWGAVVMTLDRGPVPTAVRHLDSNGEFSLPATSSVTEVRLICAQATASQMIPSRTRRPAALNPWRLESAPRLNIGLSGHVTDSRGGTVTQEATVLFEPDVGPSVARQANNDGSFELEGITPDQFPGNLLVWVTEEFEGGLEGFSPVYRISHEQHDLVIPVAPTFQVPLVDLEEKLPYELERLGPNGKAFTLLRGQFDPDHPLRRSLFLVDGRYRLRWGDNEPWEFTAFEGRSLRLPAP